MNQSVKKFLGDPKNWLTIIGGTMSACALYFGIIARLDHLESKIDKYIAVKEEQTKLDTYEMSILQLNDMDQDDKLKELEKKVFRLYAILPKELKLEN